MMKTRHKEVFITLSYMFEASNCKGNCRNCSEYIADNEDYFCLGTYFNSLTCAGNAKEDKRVLTKIIENVKKKGKRKI